MRPFPTAAILAGGLATRLRPITQTIPKSMVPVAGHPFVHHQLTGLRQQGIERVVMCLGYLGEQVQAFVGDGRTYGLHVEYAFDGDRLLGTGGALRQALPLLGEVFFILYGDSYLPISFARVWDAFQAQAHPGLMTVWGNADRGDLSNVVFSEGRIVCYDKQNRVPEMRYIDYGLSLLQAAVLAAYPKGEAFDLAVVFQRLVAEKRLAGYEVNERFYEIGSLQGIQETEAYLQRHTGK